MWHMGCASLGTAELSLSPLHSKTLMFESSGCASMDFHSSSFPFLGIVPPVHYTDVLSVPPLEFLPGNIQLYTQELC